MGSVAWAQSRGKGSYNWLENNVPQLLDGKPQGGEKATVSTK